VTSYERRSLLGTGGFAQCYEVVDIKTHEKFAAKIVSKKDLADRKTRSKLMLEIKIHRYNRHNTVH
jgi:serine/threonine protein kinase